MNDIQELVARYDTKFQRRMLRDPDGTMELYDVMNKFTDEELDQVIRMIEERELRSGQYPSGRLIPLLRLQFERKWENPETRKELCKKYGLKARLSNTLKTIQKKLHSGDKEDE